MLASLVQRVCHVAALVLWIAQHRMLVVASARHPLTLATARPGLYSGSESVVLLLHRRAGHLDFVRHELRISPFFEMR
jgi:hypothetical protein